MIKWSRGLAHEDQVGSEVWKRQKEKGKRPRLVEIWKYCIALEIILAPGNAGFRIGVLEALCATPNLETESSGLETICLGMIDVKSL